MLLATFGTAGWLSPMTFQTRAHAHACRLSLLLPACEHSLKCELEKRQKSRIVNASERKNGRNFSTLFANTWPFSRFCYNKAIQIHSHACTHTRHREIQIRISSANISSHTFAEHFSGDARSIHNTRSFARSIQCDDYYYLNERKK